VIRPQLNKTFAKSVSPLPKDKFYITNARLVLPDRVIPKATLLVKGKKIAAIVRGSFRGARNTVKIDARQHYVAPGFIDLHIHGDVEDISRRQVKGGTTGFLATLHPAKPETLLKNIARVLAQRENLDGAKALGIRLEGPFLNRAFCGALAPRFLRPPDIAEARKIIKQAGGDLKIIVLASELKGALKLTRLLKKKGITVSLGHTAATYEEAKKGIAAGITHNTHTFNRIRGFEHGEPGALGAVLTDDRVECEVICEKNHVHPAELKLLKLCKGVERISLITDSTAAQKEPPKRRAGDVFRLKDGTLYGTALTLNKALKNAVEILGLSLPEAVRCVTLNPARVLKINRNKGSLAVGKDADIVIFDKNFKVKMTIVEGENVWDSRIHRQS
jgi:N-acetylglucosamine-6-phosphate deacetylase